MLVWFSVVLVPLIWASVVWISSIFFSCGAALFSLAILLLARLARERPRVVAPKSVSSGLIIWVRVAVGAWGEAGLEWRRARGV